MDHTIHGLEPLPYHRELRDYLKCHERELWDWFASAKAQENYSEALRLELLKRTYRLDAENHGDLYRQIEEAKVALGLDIPVTAYQAQDTAPLNAVLYYIPGEGHIVFSGAVLSLLNPQELKTVIGHELAHYLLWHREDGEFLVADRMVDTIASDPRAQSSHYHSARHNRLYTEIFADRGSLRVSGDLNTAVSSLVKMQTGLSQVSGASYLKQADEIFQTGKVKTDGLSHPEAFIRARALALGQAGSPAYEEAISAMIEKVGSLDDLDLIGQVRLSELTRRVLEQLLRPKWFQTKATLAHAKLFVPEFQPAGSVDPQLAEDLKRAEPWLCDYLAYVLLDFVAADPELDEMPMAAALDLAQILRIDHAFEKAVVKELKIKARQLKKLKADCAEMLARAEAAA
jgi:hypothetical protein